MHNLYPLESSFAQYTRIYVHTRVRVYTHTYVTYTYTHAYARASIACVRPAKPSDCVESLIRAQKWQCFDTGLVLFLLAMAEPPSCEKALEKLNEQLTCPICLDHYTDPKLLHCFHVFCEKCLKPVARQTPQGGVVECPNCRHLTTLPQEGVSGLQGAFLINHLFDIQDILKKVSTPASTKCTKCQKQASVCYCRSCGFLCNACKYPHMEWKEFSTHELVSLDQLKEDATNLVPPAQKTLNCSKHPTKEVDIYCETCKEIICQYCVLKIHRDHQYSLATDAFPQQKKVLVSSVEPVEQQLSSVNKALEELQALRGEITSQRQALETQIRAEIRLAHQALEAREQVIISQLDQITQAKLKNVAAQQDQLELVATRLKSCCGFLQESLRTGSQIEILATAKPFVQQVQEMTSSFKPESLKPGEEADLEIMSSQDELKQVFQEFGKVIANPVWHAKCSAEGDGVKLAVVGERTTATVQVVDKKGRKFERPVEVGCELVSGDGSSHVGGEVNKVRDGRYEISYLPQHRGYHYLHIRVGGKHISGSPFPLSVITTTPTSITTDLDEPRGVALTDQGELVVTEYTRSSVSIISGSGDKIKFGNRGCGVGQLNTPCSVALSADGNILVADERNHRIQVFSRKGSSMRCVGSKGGGELQFINPVGVAVHPQSEKIYVTDSRVQILNKDLTFYKTFGSNDFRKGQYITPRGVSFDSTGDVYVADSWNNTVQVFTADGEYIRQFEKRGSKKNGIAIDSNDLVYVSDSDNTISIFTKEGHFLRSFGTEGKEPGQFNGPAGIYVSKNGVIYVCDGNNDRIQVF